ncbi:MAG: ABC-F family ATP-binding cassette domain-containing protein [bacterium]
MIQVTNLDKAYGNQVIFDRACFTLSPGERVGLVGRNGQGKTTLFRMLIGGEPADGGTISIPAGYSLGHLSQRIHFTGDSVLKEGCLSLKPSEEGRDETYKVKTILSGLGFNPDDFERIPSELSGGYQVRLNLAKILIAEPNLLLLDEPTNYLDILSVRWLTRFLVGWKQELILITHDRDFMDRVTTHTMGIHRCRIKKIQGSTHKLYEQILQEEEVYEKTRINDEKKRREIEQFINRFRAQANRASTVQSRIKSLQKHERLDKLSATKKLDFTFSSAPFRGKCLLQTRNLSFSFGQRTAPLISNLNLAIQKNDRIGVIGKNGKGKTTLLNLLSGELAPVEGDIDRHPDGKIAYFGQTNIDRLDPDSTVEEEILTVHPDHNRRAARTICGIMLFEGDHALKKISVLSGGERSRVLLGKMLVSPANLLFLDEPTNHLDMESIDALLEALDAFDGAVVIVTHSEMILGALANRLIVFDDDRVRLFGGTYQDFLERVGWSDENRDALSEKKTPGEAASAPRRRDARRLRAEIITERAKTLGAIQKRIAEIENAIMEHERKIDDESEALLGASMKGNGESIKSLSKSIHSSRETIESLFVELEALSSEYDRKSEEFEIKLST